MDLTFEQYQTLQQYLDDKLTPEQTKDFMRRVDSDETLRNYLRLEIALRENLAALVSEAPERYRPPGRLPEASMPVKPTPKPKVLNLKATIAIAASLLLIAAGAVWFFLNPFHKPPVAKTESTTAAAGEKPVDTSLKKNPRPEINYAALYNEFYTRDAAPPNAERPDLLAVALLDYEKGVYERIQAMDVLHPPTSRGGPLTPEEKRKFRELGHYYQALSFIETNGNEKATAGLDWIIAKSNDKGLVQKAYWYKALLQLKQADAATATALLSAAAGDTSTVTGKKAATLLHVLRK